MDTTWWSGTAPALLADPIGSSDGMPPAADGGAVAGRRGPDRRLRRGRADWLVWSDLPAATQDGVTRMVEWEADTTLLVGVRYLRDRTGRVLTRR